MLGKLHLLFVFTIICYSSIVVAQSHSSTDVNLYLLQQVQSNNLNPSDIANYKITSQHTSNVSDVLHIYFRQSFNGNEVIGTESSIHIKNGNLIQGHNNFIKDIDQKIGIVSPSISEIAAIQSIAEKMNYSITGSLTQIPNTTPYPEKMIFSNGGISIEDIPVQLVYRKLTHGKWVATWEVTIREITGHNWFDFFVDASNGNIITKNNWTTECTVEHVHDHSEKVPVTTFTKAATAKSPTTVTNSVVEGSTYNVFAVPLATPLQGDRSIVVDPHNPAASPFGWHDTNGAMGPEFTVTEGNNVNAFEGGNNNGFQPDGGDVLIFDYPFNPVYTNANQSEEAVITNLFYWNNIIHDVTYIHGFDEASGNFQVNNYGNGGLGNDSVNALAQIDFVCNATFSSPPDGISGQMNMFICGNRDGDVDNLVVIHEYAHGISTRLTGGGGNSNCLFNDEQMGEGWSDWYGTVLTIEPGDVGTDLRPVGNWLVGQDANGPGIRAFPYTTDLAQDPRTYNSIQNTGGAPHPVGSVWTAMLWEVTWALIEEHGFDSDLYNGTGGNNMAIALVTEGLKLQPCSPGFVDGRDAILAADVALYGGENQCLIWEAFAKRGLGASADQGSTNSRNDGTEAFDIPSTLITTPDIAFCISETAITLDGGSPVGGVYSGPGVTNTGDGITYTFDPAAAGIGIHTITYAAETECSDGNTATATIEVRNDTPILECQDFTVDLDETGTITITPPDVIANFPTGDEYTIDQSGDFATIDITASGTGITLGDDQLSNALPLGFDFIFFGETYQNFHISSNGFITFTGGQGSGCCNGESIPGAGDINNFIAFAWADVNPSAGGNVRYETVGTAPNRVLVMEFDNVPYFGSANTVTSQVQLYEGSNQIEIHSASIDPTGPATQGIENLNGTSGLPTPGRNSQTWSATNDYVAFVPNVGVFPSNCGNETTITLDVDSFDCDDIGENTVTVTVIDSEGNTASCTAIVTVQNCVLSIDENALSEQIDLYPNPTNSSFTLRWNPNNAIDTLEIYDITGKKVSDLSIESGISQRQVDISSLKSGVYLVKVSTPDAQTFIQKLIIN